MPPQFGLDVDLAATLGRLAAAEYRCCSFGSYTIVVDGTGLRLEVRMPVEAAETMAAVLGVPDQPVPVVEAHGAPRSSSRRRCVQPSTAGSPSMT